MTPEVYQKNYDKALAEYKTICFYSKISIPLIVIIGAAAAWFISEEMGKVVAGMVSLLILALNILLLGANKTETYHHFPVIKLNDLVIYNPIIDDKGNRKFKISKEHPILNKHIPKWNVVSIASTSFVIQYGSEIKELSFRSQDDILVQPANLEEIPVTPVIEAPKPNPLAARNLVTETRSGLAVAEFSNEVLANQEQNIKNLLLLTKKDAPSEKELFDQDELL